MKHYRAGLVLLQPQLLAQLRVRFLITGLLDFGKIGVFKEEFLDLL